MSSPPCPVCMETPSYVAISSNCDHTVCSKCMLRLKTKVGANQCPLCKLSSEYHIIASVSDAFVADTDGSLNLKVFSMYGVLPGVGSQGVILDDRAKFMFYQCSDHYAELDLLQSIYCRLCVSLDRAKSVVVTSEKVEKEDIKIPQ